MSLSFGLRWRQLVGAIVVAAGLTAAVAPFATVSAFAPIDQACQKASGSSVCSESPGNGAVDPVSEVLRKVTNILAIVLGVIAVIFIIIAGFTYITAGGDSSSIATAKKTIIYALIGLLVALLARPIINFVLGTAVK